MKIIRIKYQSSPVETSKVPPHMHTHKGRQLLFDDDLVRQPFDEVSQEKIEATHGRETLANRDICEYEWAMQYVNSNKKFVLLTSHNKWRGQLAKDRPFNYD